MSTQQPISIIRVDIDEPLKKILILYKDCKGEIKTSEGFIRDQSSLIKCVKGFRGWGFKLLAIQVLRDDENPNRVGKFIKFWI